MRYEHYELLTIQGNKYPKNQVLDAISTLPVAETPYNTLPITLMMQSLEQKVYRHYFCIECGHPFMSVSDKAIMIVDDGAPVETLERGEDMHSAECRYSRCRQRYRLRVGKGS